MPQDWRSGCKSHRPKHMRLIRRELENIVVPADFVGERLAGDKVGACLRRSMFSLNHVTELQLFRYEVWAQRYEREHWTAAASGADYANRLVKNFKELQLRLKVQWLPFKALRGAKLPKLHAHVAGFGPRWPAGIRRDLDAISILTKSDPPPGRLVARASSRATSRLVRRPPLGAMRTCVNNNIVAR